MYGQPFFDFCFMMKKRTFLILLISIFIICIVLFIPSYTVLSISARKTPSQRIFLRAGYKDGFIISYTHSVNKGRVHDFYKTTDSGQLELYKTQFVSYGAGIPEPGETPGALFTVKDGGYVIENLNRIVPRLTMAVGIIANHSLATGKEFIGQKEYQLTDYFPPQTSIILEIKRISLFAYFKHSI